MAEAREPNPTVGFVDNYCQWYRDLLVEVRSLEAVKHLHLGMISEVKRKSLSAAFFNYVTLASLWTTESCKCWKGKN